MKSYSIDLRALLDSGVPVYRVELFAIGTCENGSYIYATNGQVPITYNGQRYEPALFGSWSRGDVEVRIGLESNSSQLTVFADNQVPIYFPGTSNGALLIDGIKFGLLGSAKVVIYTAYYSPHLPGYSYGTTVGPTGGSLVEIKFVGMVGNVDRFGITSSVMTIQDMLYVLNQQIPRRVFQAPCSHVLFDAACALNAASFTKAGAVATVPYPYYFTTTAHLVPTSSSGTFAQGVLIWTSGQNNGLASFVRMWDPVANALQLDVQPIFPIQPGDTFTITQGCNQTFASCADLQGPTNAYINYGGQPNIPVPETAIG
jgi:hypothetical protein